MGSDAFETLKTLKRLQAGFAAGDFSWPPTEELLDLVPTIIDDLERGALYHSALLYIKTGKQTARSMREVAIRALAHGDVDA